MPAALAKLPDAQPRATIDVARPSGTQPVDSALLKMVAQTKASPLKIMRDFLSLTFGPGRVSFRDYTILRLFDDAYYPDKRAVVGQLRGAEYHEAANYRSDWWGLMGNKVALASYLAAHGFPTIAPLALYAAGVGSPSDKVVGDAAGLRRLLADPGHYPLFGKPTEALQSLGSVALCGYHAGDDSVETMDGRALPLNDLIADIVANYASGYLFQRFTTPHAKIRALCGDKLSTARIMTINGDGNPKLFRACWKIPAGANTADNYWRGNLLAQLDLTQGRVVRAISGTGLDLVERTHHPDSGVALAGFEIPHWRAMVDMALEAARAMRHVGLIGFDMAALDGGPVIVEMNERPDFVLPQLADKRGVLDPEFLDFIEGQKRRALARRKAQRAALKADV